MSAKVNKDAALHLALGALKPGDIPPGHHDLGNVEVTIRFPPFAAVDRAEGTQGGGYFHEGSGEQAGITLTLGMAMRYLDKAGVKNTATLWAECIRECLQGCDLPLPRQVEKALAMVQAKQPPSAPAAPTGQKTPAKRTGEKEATITIKRLPKTTAVKKESPGRKK